MNLYKLTQRSVRGYDTYDSAVVASKDEADACTIHPDGREEPVGQSIGYLCRSSWPNRPEDVTAQLIGRAHKDIRRGVILASFNAG